MSVIFSAHVQIVVDDDDKKKKSIVYRPDGADHDSIYIPSGWMENKAVNGLVEKLTKV